MTRGNSTIGVIIQAIDMGRTAPTLRSSGWGRSCGCIGLSQSGKGSEKRKNKIKYKGETEKNKKITTNFSVKKISHHHEFRIINKKYFVNKYFDPFQKLW
jgi:hypothetical protein